MGIVTELFSKREKAKKSSNADSPTGNKGELLFVKPWEEQQSFADFIDFVSEQEESGEEKVSEVRYAQTRELT
jgi:jumonji domain-containing protein 7